jgi:phosphoglycolate phosphatase
MTDLRLAIWDVDGTLVDSRETIHNVMVEAFRQSGLVPPEYDDTRRIVGLSLHEACAQLAPDASADEIARLVTDYRNTWVRARAQPDFHQPLYEGALETLEALRDEGWLIAMATGKTRAGIASLFKLHRLEHFFDTIWCADDGPGKPHPAHGASRPWMPSEWRPARAS